MCTSGFDYRNQTNLLYLRNKTSSDFFMMCFAKMGCDIFYPKSTFAEGRNSALRLALSFDPGNWLQTDWILFSENGNCLNQKYGRLNMVAAVKKCISFLFWFPIFSGYTYFHFVDDDIDLAPKKKNASQQSPWEWVKKLCMLSLNICFQSLTHVARQSRDCKQAT